MKLHFDENHILHAFKVGFACILGFILTILYSPESSQWILITIIVVMGSQVNVGSTVQKAIMRCLGTILGVFIAVLTLLIFGTNPFPRYTILFLTILTFSYFAAKYSNYTYAGSLGALTATIGLFGPDPTILYALNRFYEIFFGVIISVFVTVFVYPRRASEIYENNVLKMISKLKEFYNLAVDSSQRIRNNNKFDFLEDKLIKDFSENRKLVLEFKMEPGRKRFNSHDVKNIDYSFRIIFRAIFNINSAINSLLETEPDFFQTKDIAEFNNSLSECFCILKKQFSKKNDLDSYLKARTSLELLENGIKKLSSSSSYEEQQLQHLFLNCAKEIVSGTEKLYELFSK